MLEYFDSLLETDGGPEALWEEGMSSDEEDEEDNEGLWHLESSVEGEEEGSVEQDSDSGADEEDLVENSS